MKAVLLYKDTYNQLGLPGEYPAETKDIQNSSQAVSPWIAMRDSEVESRIAQYSETVRQITLSAEAVPQEVLLWQFRAAVALAGLKEAVETELASLHGATKTIATDKWEYGNTVKRYHPTTVSLGAAIGLSPSQIDDIFKTAASLQ